MELNIEDMKKYVIENLAGTKEDIEFIESLVNIALVKTEDIEKYKNYIIFNIENIKSYINPEQNIQLKGNTLKKGIKEIEEIFGFIDEFEFKDGEKGNFYLFVANIKIKAVAFLCRMYVFIQNYYNHTEDDWRKQEEKVFESARKDIENFFTNSENNIEKILDMANKKSKEESEKNKYHLKNGEIEKVTEEKEGEVTYELTKECKEAVCCINNALKKVECSEFSKIISSINRISDKPISDRMLEFEERKKMSEEMFEKKREDRSLRYFLFDNSMNEVEFFGVENRFNWLWEQESEVYLYRNATEKESNENLEGKKSYEYMKSLMEHVILQTSGNANSIAGLNSAVSYSRNPIRDFYKYLDFPKEKDLYNNLKEKDLYNIEYHCKISNMDVKNMEVTVKKNFYDVKATFEIVKGVNTNSLKILSEKSAEVDEVSFYHYLKKIPESYDKTLFCIEFCKQNSIVPDDGDRRLNSLENYLHTWGIEGNFVRTRISDTDDEVITSSEYFKNEFKNEKEEVHSYNLNIKEIWAILYLMYNLEGNYNLEANYNYPQEYIDERLTSRICGELKSKIQNSKLEDKIKASITRDKFEKNSTNQIDNKSIEIKIDMDKEIGIKIIIEIVPEFFCNPNITEAILVNFKSALLDKILEDVPKEVTCVILTSIEEILTPNEGKSKIEEIIKLMEDGIKKDSGYKKARKDEFEIYSKNPVLNFWKKIFKEVNL